MKKVKLAFLGTGPRGQGLIGTYKMHDKIEFVSLCDSQDGLAQQIAATYFPDGSVKAYKSYEEMLKGPGFDLLMIAMDPDIQADYAVDAMNRGIHVMTEVPAAFSVKQCRALVNAVEKNGVKYQLGEQTRYWHFIKQFREMAERDEFGKIVYAEGHYQHHIPAYDDFVELKTGRHIGSHDPGLFADPELRQSWRGRCLRNPIFYLPHTLSPLLSVTGGRITKVACFGTRPLSYAAQGFNYRDMQHAIMYNSDDILFSVRASFSMPHGDNCLTGTHWYQLKGTKASVETPRSTIDGGKKWTVDDNWSEMPQHTEDDEAEDYIKSSGHGGADFYPIDAMVNAILNDTTPPMDVYKAVETAAPAILAAESCEKGGVMLEVPDFRKR
ncbi:MAG: Gfo/Idh/MocA family oxidoreductase [Oscillospiraceae bacterium]|nr:Gfo/Idh/MocA family oxidoreductase [Oscillospiraceae bacterium]